jgi:hypothetical protein
MSEPEPADRPRWLTPDAELVAVTTDVVSGLRFRLWYDAVPARRRLGPRPRPRPDDNRALLVEHVGSDVPVASLGSWSEAVAWHGRSVISSGWEVVYDGKGEARDWLPVDPQDAARPADTGEGSSGPAPAGGF